MRTSWLPGFRVSTPVGIALVTELAVHRDARRPGYAHDERHAGGLRRRRRRLGRYGRWGSGAGHVVIAGWAAGAARVVATVRSVGGVRAVRSVGKQQAKAAPFEAAPGARGSSSSLTRPRGGLRLRVGHARRRRRRVLEQRQYRATERNERASRLLHRSNHLQPAPSSSSARPRPTPFPLNSWSRQMGRA